MITLSDFECGTAYLGNKYFYIPQFYRSKILWLHSGMYQSDCIVMVYIIIFHTKNIELITRNLEFTRKRKKNFI